jgi:hypothetical protein
MNPGLISSRETKPIHDKSDRNIELAPPRLLRLRNGIFLQSRGRLLVRGRSISLADAYRRERLPVPGLLAEAGGETTGGGIAKRVSSTPSSCPGLTRASTT